MSVLTRYIGRFAPSPTGSLHFGSLVTALASYLDARTNQGLWLVRMEDIDPPREQPGAADQILQSLDDHCLQWDGAVLYQSSRLDHYHHIVEQLLDKGLAYPCACSRQQLGDSPIYTGTCKRRPPAPGDQTAIRIQVANQRLSFNDEVQGPQHQQMASEVGDFVIRRKDSLIAYQLAVALDDLAQGITKVLRGSDLLHSTSRQLYLMQLLQPETKRPRYCHIPVVVNREGQKLSKQNLATPLSPGKSGENLYQALQVLGQQPPTPLRKESAPTILSWARQNWQLACVPRGTGIKLPRNAL